jgi:hypothetical protein
MYNFYEIQKKMKELSTQIQMCDSILKISSSSIDEMKTKFKCCKGLAEEYNNHLKSVSNIINVYNNVLSRVKQGKWLSQNIEISTTISKLIGQSKTLLGTLFKFDKKLTDNLISLVSSKGKDREAMIGLMNLPLPPSHIIKGGAKLSTRYRSKNNKKKTMKKKSKTYKYQNFKKYIYFPFFQK